VEVKSSYKQTEVGAIPHDWEVKSVRELAQIKTGPFGTLLKASEYAGAEGVPLISVGEVGAGRFKITEHTPLVPAVVVRRLPQYVLRTGDIVFGRKGAVERSALVTENEDGWFLGSDGIGVRPRTECFPPYLSCQFQRHAVQTWLLQNATGTTMPSLNQAILGNVQIPYAPISEQRAIAAALSDVDALLAGLDRLIAKKRDLKQAAMQQLLTGHTRLPGFQGEWQVKPLGELSDVKTGPFGSSLHESDYVADGTPIITVEHLGEFGVEHVNLPMVSEVDCRRLHAYSLDAGDIVFSRVGSVDRNALIRPPEAGWLFSGRLLRVRPDQRQLWAPYLSYQFHSEPFKALVRSVAVGQTMASLNTQILKGINVAFPTLNEQTAIATILADMDAELTALEARRDKTRALKQGMMQELLTGRTRLV